MGLQATLVARVQIGSQPDLVPALGNLRSVVLPLLLFEAENLEEHLHKALVTKSLSGK